MTAGRERAIDLLIERTTVGLESARQDELERLLVELPELDDDSFDLAAAAIELAGFPSEQPLPVNLRLRLVEQAAEHFAAGEGGAAVESFAEHTARRPAPSAGRWLGWAAAAAALLVAVFSWLPERRLDPAEERGELIAQAGDLLQLEWTATEDPAAAGAGGDLVWSNATQTGYMRLRGLEVNDPTVSQYQIWIFDAERDERFPVDGGVFDVTTEGEVVVPIDPRLEIARPTLFAITVEKPGGVVVSSRERLSLLAQVG